MGKNGIAISKTDLCSSSLDLEQVTGGEKTKANRNALSKGGKLRGKNTGSRERFYCTKKRPVES